MAGMTGCTLLAAVLFCVQAAGQHSNKVDTQRHASMFAANEYFAKGGLGIVNPNLYVDVKSARNELRLSGGNKWVGKNALMPEVVIFFGDKVWSPQALPEGFDISQAIVVSFEAERVRFFDFEKMSGGFYRRQR
jgi:hypothetical protein